MNASDLTLVVQRHDPAETEIHLTARRSRSRPRLLGPRVPLRVDGRGRLLVPARCRDCRARCSRRSCRSRASLPDPSRRSSTTRSSAPPPKSRIRRTLGLRGIQLGPDGFRIIQQRRPCAWQRRGVARRRLDDAAAQSATVRASTRSFSPVTPGQKSHVWADADTSWGFPSSSAKLSELVPICCSLVDRARGPSARSCLGWIVDPALAPPPGFVGVRTAPGTRKPPPVGSLPALGRISYQ